MAECSESTGMISAPDSRAAACMSSPGADHRLFIGKGDALFFADGRQRGPQRGKAAHGHDDRIGLRQSRRLAQRLRARKHPYIHIRQTDF